MKPYDGPTGSDIVLQSIKEQGLPLTRETYLDLAYPEDWGWEVEL